MRSAVWVLAVTLVMLLGCSGGGSGSAAVSGIEKIVAYAEGGDDVPTVTDYRQAGVRGVVADNLAQMNRRVRSSEPDAVDTPEELQEIVETLFAYKGPYPVLRYPESGLTDDHYVVYYPEDGITQEMPVVVFLEGGGRDPEIDDYRGVMEFLASQGYFVIGAESGESYDSDYARRIVQSAFDTAREAHGLAISRLAVMGHSQGGGQAFYVMRYFQDPEHGGYGSEGSLVFSIDGWFAFSMDQEDLRTLKGDVAFLQMNGLEGTGTDPRIDLTIWNLASSTQRRFLTLPEDEHSYVMGSFEELLESKKDLLQILGALSYDTFNGGEGGYAAIPGRYKNSYDAIAGALQPMDEYPADCNGTAYNARINQLQYNDIDYCTPDRYRR